ncbi:hypothetical protein CCH79_00019403 [Gambusia affinis]|uniref:GLTSCR protein conserved domain-containing protein n=1 Tax=Gambusia affinis TaxID=33528 RepID=A0A315W9S1_GAMAF|nr:hypothetical protein CCH79_00019403 [Gambusia affinis]
MTRCKSSDPEALNDFLHGSETHEQRHQTENESTQSVGVPASVIVSSNSVTTAAPAVHDSQLTDSWLGQSHSPSPGPSHMTAVVKVPSGGAQQALKIQGMSSSPALTSHATTPPVAESPQPSQSPLTLTQQIQSPHHQQPPQSRPSSQPQTPSRSCTPSSHTQLFIVHNQIAESPKPAATSTAQAQLQQTPPQQVHVQVQHQPLPRPASQPTPYQQEMPPMSQSPKPLPAAAAAAPPALHQFAAPPVSACAPAVVKAQVPLQGLTAGQQHHLQLVGAQIQTLSSITQPSPQHKQLLEKLQQVKQNIMLQAKPQPQATSQFNSQQDVPVDKVVMTSSAGSDSPAQLPTMLQPTSVLVKTAAAGSSDLQVFSGAAGQAAAAATGNQTVTLASLTQPAQVQPKPGVISSVGGMTLGKAAMKIQVLGPALTQMPVPQPQPPLQTQLTSQTPPVKMPLSTEPSKEARMLEQLRKHQGSVLHPNYSAPFHSFDDTLHRLLPYHLYQGTANSSQDYQRVDDEFERVSCQLLKRTQAMLDKYRYLLFTESKRLGPSAEMVMIDRMFIQEEKVALNQDRILAKERPEEFAATVRMLESGVPSQPKPAPLDLPSASPAASTAAPALIPSPAPLLKVAPTPPPAPPAPPAPASPTPPPAPTIPSSSPFPPTKLVIKHGGGSASVSWSSSCPPAPAAKPVAPAAPSSSSSSSSALNSQSAADDDDALPQRTSKPPIKTYEARSRIGLKLKIKQDQTGFSKVVHNTALDPVHAPQPRSTQEPLPEPAKSQHLATPPNTVIRTQSPTASVTPTQSNLRNAPPSSSTTTQMNGSLDHHPVKHNPAASQTTCRLPLRKTYRENISPRVRPGVPGGLDESFSYPITTPSPPRHEASTPPSERTVIASVRVEKRDREADPSLEGGRLGNTMDKMNEVFNRSSDSPDMDNASFSSGSPPDDSLNEHLQCAIDSILNLQQEPAVRGHHVRAGAGSRSHQHQSQRPGDSAVSTHRAPPPTAPSAPSSSSLGPQVGGRGHNGSLVPQTQSR